jgi:hypothetical protein
MKSRVHDYKNFRNDDFFSIFFFHDNVFLA